MSYAATLSRVETYFDTTATAAWARLTSDAPVSRIRATVRAGRARMRDHLLGLLPPDLDGARVLDAGCGTGAMSAELATRGAEVVAADIAPALLEIAASRLPATQRPRVRFLAIDMLSPDLGRFDHVVAMDSLIYYREPDLARALSSLAGRSRGGVLFTIAPRTPLLMAMWRLGQVFPRGQRSPAMVPHAPARLQHALGGRAVRRHARVTSGFYISQALELAP